MITIPSSQRLGHLLGLATVLANPMQLFADKEGTVTGSSTTLVEPVERMPPIPAEAMIQKMFDDEKTRMELEAGAKKAWLNHPIREFPRPLRVLVLSTAPVGPHISIQNLPYYDEAARKKKEETLAEFSSPEELDAASLRRKAGIRQKNLHGLGVAAMLTLLREMDRLYEPIHLTEITDEHRVTQELIAAHDVVLLNSVGMTDRDELFNQWLPDFVRKGGGVVANHGAVYLYVDQPEAEYNRMLGGRLHYFPFAKAHPEKGGGKYTVRLPDPKDPLVASLIGKEQEPFADELYTLVVDQRQPPKVLVEIDPEKMIQEFPKDADDFTRAVIWTQSYGQGRVWYMQFGHFPRALHDPRVAELLLDGLIYASGNANVEAPDAQSKAR